MDKYPYSLTYAERAEVDKTKNKRSEEFDLAREQIGKVMYVPVSSLLHEPEFLRAKVVGFEPVVIVGLMDGEKRKGAVFLQAISQDGESFNSVPLVPNND